MQYMIDWLEFNFSAMFKDINRIALQLCSLDKQDTFCYISNIPFNIHCYY